MISTLIAAALTANMQAVDFHSKLQKDEMAKLNFLVGYWEGTTTYYSGGREIIVQGYENVRSVAGGTAILIDAQYTMDRGGQKIPIHDVAAIMRFDPEKKVHLMRSQLGNGLTGEYEIKVRENGYDWSTQGITGTGTTDYVMNISPEGDWVEVGYSVDGDKRTKLMELRLKKIK
ncbi:MAG: hypothetical protein ACKVQS_02590 [Fimbriimonadaceae bacterium]